MGKTPILQLDTNNSTTDATQKFLTYRMNQNGDISSNMTKIDKWAGTVNTDIEQLKNNKPTILLNATWMAMGYYEAVTSEITEFKLDMLVTLRLNTDNDGTLTMKINELPVKSFLKYDSTGNLVNLDVGDLRKNREYQFRYDGTSFVWQGGTSADQLNIVGTSGNIVSVDADNTIHDSGVSAEQVNTNKTNIGTKETLTTANKTDLVSAINEIDGDVGDVSTLTTVAKTSTVEAINEVNAKTSTDITYDNVTSGLVATNVKEAIDESVSKINVLSDNTYKRIDILRSGTVLNHILNANSQGIQNGIFGMVYDVSITDAPDTNWGECRFTKHAAEIWTVEWFSSSTNTMFKRQIYVDHWGTDKWEPIATTTKTDILFENGWGSTGVGAPCVYKTGNIAYISVGIKNGSIADNTTYFSLPLEFRPKTTHVFMCSTLSGAVTRVTISATGEVRQSNRLLPPAGEEIYLNMTWGLDK